jgi:hypothetical protein
MFAARSTSTVAANSKALRRSPDSWRGDHLARVDRAKSDANGHTIPLPRHSDSRTGEHLEARMRRVNSRWSFSEREYRRLQALRKQEELLLLLAGDDLESVLRTAVADGEHPVYSPECADLED